MADFEALRQRHVAERDRLLPGLIARLDWDADALRRERQQRLRVLLATAKAQSPWHRERLRDVDPATFTEADLPQLPAMTKADMMDHFDDVVTDRRLTRALVDRQVEELPENPYLFDRYVALASGGSSGRRGIFVYDWQAFAVFSAAIVRWRMRRPPPAPPWASLWAGRGAHASWLGTVIFPPPAPVERVPPTAPLGEIVARLNGMRPGTLSGYASTLALLAAEARAGRLRIAPTSVINCGEPLLPEMRAAIEAVWPVHVDDYYGMSEGLYAFGCAAGDAMHWPDDLVCIEPVDEAGRPVPPGVPAARMYLTNLYNPTQPLIRYEVTDRLVVVDEPCACGCVHRRLDQLVGRSDDAFTYPGGVVVHPLVIRAPLGRAARVAEYQVLQTERGVHVRVCADGDLDAGALARALVASLERGGLAQPSVTIDVVPELSRLASGKVKRFVSL